MDNLSAKVRENVRVELSVLVEKLGHRNAQLAEQINALDELYQSSKDLLTRAIETLKVLR